MNSSMQIIRDEQGNYFAEFRTQHNTLGRIALDTCSQEQAQDKARDMRIEALEQSAALADLSHQVVGQIIAGRTIVVADALLYWEAHLRGVLCLSVTTVATNVSLVRTWAIRSQILDRPITTISSSHVASYINAGAERRSTALRKLAAIRSFYAYLLSEGLVLRDPSARGVVRVTYDPFTHEELEPRNRETFTEAECQAVLAAASTFWKAATSIALDTGLRLSDICQLEWASIGGTRLAVWTDKSNKRVELPLTDRVNDILSSASTTNPPGRFVFAHEREVLLDPKRRSLLSTQFSRLCRSVGIVGKSFHCLRHTYATRQRAEGLTMEQVASNLGHSSTETTRIYVHDQPRGRDTQPTTP